MACFAFAFSSCDSVSVYDDLPQCEQGFVRVNVYVERFLGDLDVMPFQGVSPLTVRSQQYEATSEKGLFGERIKTLSYYLYRDNILVEQGEVDDIEGIGNPHYVFERADLPHGDYHLVLMGNCTEKEMKSGFDDPMLITLSYQENDDDRNDCFMDCFEFSVNDNGEAEYDTQLKRVHGVVRYTFNDVDPDIKTIEVTMDGLTSTGCVAGTYSDDYTFVRRIAVNQPAPLGRADGDEVELLPNEPTVVGLFPTTDTRNSTWSVKVYREDGETEYYSGQVSDNVRVIRNDLLDLTATFVNGKILFYVDMDLVWEGVLDVNGGIVN